MNSRLLGAIGALLALWMSVGRLPFGITGPLALWLLPTVGLGYAALQLWLARRLRITRDLGKRTRRSVYVALILSWICAIGFGFTVPEQTTGGLTSLLSSWSGSAFSTEMSIALCNPFGIIAFTLTGFALGYAFADVRERTEEDEEAWAEGSLPMPKHPLA